ncbi:MAG: signal peptidase I [Chitinophagaceae bacterium]
MKDGLLFVNGEDFDNDMIVQQEYLLSTENASAYETIKNFTENEIFPAGNVPNQPNHLQYRVFLTKRSLNELKAELKNGDSLARLIDAEHYYLSFFSEEGHPEWTLDNFGPLTVPPGNYFVLGDNRHNAQDSRFFGIVKKEKITGVVVR